MSTKNPLDAGTCDTCTSNRFVCAVKAAVCRLQNFVEPLCTRKETPYDSNLYTEFCELRRAMLKELAQRGAYSEALHALPATLFEWRDWFDLALEQLAVGAVPTAVKEARKKTLGKLTIANRIGLAFAHGTSCVCCVAYRGLVGWGVAFGLLGYVLSAR